MKNLILLIIDDLFPIALNILKHSDLYPFSRTPSKYYYKIQKKKITHS